MIDAHYQIGEVADQVGLSLRTIRYYEEIGLVTPSGRTEGGFRLYTERDIDRLTLVKTLKPLGMSLDEMKQLVANVDLGGESASRSARLDASVASALERCETLEQKLADARQALDRLRAPSASETR